MTAAPAEPPSTRTPTPSLPPAEIIRRAREERAGMEDWQEVVAGRERVLLLSGLGGRVAER